MTRLLLACALLASCTSETGAPPHDVTPDAGPTSGDALSGTGDAVADAAEDALPIADAADVAPDAVEDPGDEAAEVEPDAPEVPDVPDTTEDACVPSCIDLECGDNGCGGSCGECTGTLVCVSGQCQCVPHCTGKDCGDDGCGGSCGECGAGQACVGFKCACATACDGKQCGEDGCGGSCGTCKPFFSCDQGLCACTPQCDGKACGGDGCGGDCGPCSVGDVCTDAFVCVSPCADQCDGKECGLGTCGSSCGSCAAGLACKQGVCKDPSTCTPSCVGLLCGSDGCFGSCGSCGAGTWCQDGECTATCTPACAGKLCGDDGCGGQCGACPAGIPCTTTGVCGNACTSCLYQDACFAQSFESGDLGGWVPGGKAEVTASLGAATPTEGVHMLALSTGAVAEGGISSEASFPTCLPTGTYQLRFDMKVYSEQFLEWCGSPLQDAFTVTLVGPNGETALIDYAMDDLCPAAACATCGDHYIGLSPAGVHFDQGATGDVWTTPWVTETAFVKAVGGEPFQLRFGAEDAGDAQLDTVVLVDGVELVPCVPKCAGKTCGDDGCGGSCGGCQGPGQQCLLGVCCAPSCKGKMCGSDGCGGWCGTCNDKDPCTSDTCDVNGQCGFDKGDPLCCDSDLDCNDGKACTKDLCSLEAGACQFVPLEGLQCCLKDADCDDGDDVCTPLDDCAEGLCTHSVGTGVECCDPAPFAFDFAASAQGFTVTNDLPGKGWSWTDQGAHNESPSAFYYGDPATGTYQFGGATTAGSVMSPTLALPPGHVTLTFAAYADVEWGFADSLEVRARVDGGAPVVVWTKLNPGFGMLQWKTYSVDLSAFAGKAVTLEWRFDTQDFFGNTTEGVYLDDVAVTSTCQPKDCIQDAACNDGIDATTESCVSGSCLYGLP